MPSNITRMPTQPAPNLNATTNLAATSSAWLFIGFSGRRKIAKDKEPLLRKALAGKLAEIQSTAGHARLAAVSSAGEGADLLFVDTFLNQHPEAPWIAHLPFPKDEFLNAQSPANNLPDFSQESREHARRLLDEKAARIIGISEDPQETPRQTPAAATATAGTETQRLKERRNHAFEACTRKTVEDCDILVAIWDGGASDKGNPKPGGTTSAIEYARELGKPIFWIHTETAQITEEPPAAPSAPPPVAEPLSLPGNLAGISPNQTLQERKNRVTAILKIFSERAGKLNKLLRAPQLSSLILNQVSIAIALVVLIWFNRNDESGGNTHRLASGLELAALLALLAALVIIPLLHRARARWIENRLQAEICRSVRAVWDIKGGETILPALHLPAFESLQRHLFLLRVAWTPAAPATPASPAAPAASPPLAQVRDDYPQNRIADQINYFNQHGAKAVRSEKRLKRLASIFTGLAILLTVAGFLWQGAARDTIGLVIKTIALNLPLASAAILASIGALDVGRRAVRYAAMRDFLEKATPRFTRIDTWTELREAAAEVERILLLEVWEWNSVSRFSSQQ